MATNATDITINDGESTPVAHVFEPADRKPGVTGYEDKSSGIFIGFWRVTLGLLRPNGTARTALRNIKARYEWKLPVMEVVSNSTVSGIAPAATVAYQMNARLVVTMPERCTLQDRENMHALIVNGMQHADFKSVMVDFDLPQ